MSNEGNSGVTRHRMLQIVEASSESHIDQVRNLFVEYWEWFGFEPCFQNFDKELAGLPGDYEPPDGCILIAHYDAVLAGCVALRKLGEGRCEMKRLFVRPRFRGKKIGFSLVSAIIDEARKRDYAAMRLDTLPVMEKAIAIYRSLGFEDVAPYTEERVAGAKYLELKL